MWSFWKLSTLAVYVFLVVRRSHAMEHHERVSEEGASVILHQSNLTQLTAKEIQRAGYELQKVKHITIIGAAKLEHIEVEDLTKIPNLKSLFITQAPKLMHVQPLPRLLELRTLIITTSGLTEVPNLSRVHDHNSTNSSRYYFQAVDLEGNHIRRIPHHALRVRADQVSLNYNLIEEVPAHVFKNAVIAKLSFRGNTKLKRINEQAFSGNLLLRQLDLSDTAITHLPTKGLEKLEILRIEKTPTLKHIPSIYEFRHLKEAYLTHSFHCCAFDYPAIHDPAKHALYQKEQARMVERCKHTTTLEPSSATRSKRSLPVSTITISNKFEDKRNGWEEMDDYAYDSTPVTSSEEISDNGEDQDKAPNLVYDGEGVFHQPVTDLAAVRHQVDCGNFTIEPRKVHCEPLPNALNPCEDVMGWTWLRASVWVVITAAVVGNMAVLIVLLANRSELTVPRFLMCHLALADLCTGLYLFMIAIVDLRSYGEFFNYAYDWQYGVGCKIAGFLSVFSGQLSVFTLTIVTLERWFAITYAIYLERRISLLTAAKIMLGGWMFSIIMAGLPLAGVSDYSSTSICLPVESKEVVDAVYQGNLFLTNAVAWITIVVCYVQIYRSLGGGGEKYGGRGAAAAAERRIANKMALLVGTDLLCWAPVAFFGVTALAGVPLVDVSHGKVLLVFFYPLNACANPFLYAILTKQYRRDFINLIARSGCCNWLVERYKLAATPPPTAHTHPSAPSPLLPLDTYHRSQSQISKDTNGEIGL